MADLTEDPNDPRLGHGIDTAPAPQNRAYVVLPQTERSKGYVRPVRRTYIHVGVGGHEIDPTNPARHGRTNGACGTATTMPLAIAQTYARDPHFYGSTYCVGCGKHLAVAEFVWDDGTVVGS